MCEDMPIDNLSWLRWHGDESREGTLERGRLYVTIRSQWEMIGQTSRIVVVVYYAKAHCPNTVC
jgi:hypothetical protein